MKTTKEQLTLLLSRLAFVPGFDKLTDQAIDEYHGVLGGYFPHEIDSALNRCLSDPELTWVPLPGKIAGIAQAARKSHYKHSWDGLLPILERDERTFLGQRADIAALSPASQQLIGGAE